MDLDIHSSPYTADIVQVNSDANVYTPAQALNSFLDRCRTVNTRKAYLSALNSFFEHGCPNDSVIFQSLASTERVQQWLNDMLRAGKGRKKPSTAIHRYTVLRNFFEACCSWGLLKQNPADKYLVTVPKAPAWQPSLGLMSKDIQAMIKVCSDDKNKAVGLRDRAIIMLGFSCCLRVSEIHYLNTNDIKKGRRKVKIHLLQTKGGHEQTVDLADSVKRAIEDYILQIGGLDVITAEPNINGVLSRPVFVTLAPGNYGNRISISYLSKMIKKRGKQAGVDLEGGVHSHLLRHSGISHMFEIGMDIDDIRKFARHQNIEMTSRYRDLWLDSQKQSAADALSDIFAGF